MNLRLAILLALTLTFFMRSNAQSECTCVGGCCCAQDYAAQLLGTAVRQNITATVCVRQTECSIDRLTASLRESNYIDIEVFSAECENAGGGGGGESAAALNKVSAFGMALTLLATTLFSAAM